MQDQEPIKFIFILETHILFYSYSNPQFFLSFFFYTFIAV